MPTIVPERTIDSLFSYEALLANPEARIFSPPNNAGPGTPDHHITMGSKSLVFELKTLSRVSLARPTWYVDVPEAQLTRYSTVAPKTIYVLPAEPKDPNRPWIRDCATDPDSSGRCQACYAGFDPADLVSRRRWAANHTNWQGQSPEVLMQPWFNHWSWCVPAKDLTSYVIANRVSKLSGSWRIDATDSVLSAVPRAMRLCHLLQTLRGNGPSSPNGGPPPDPPDLSGGADGSLDEGSSEAAGQDEKQDLSKSDNRSPDVSLGGVGSIADVELMEACLWFEGESFELTEDSRISVLEL